MGIHRERRRFIRHAYVRQAHQVAGVGGPCRQYESRGRERMCRDCPARELASLMKGRLSLVSGENAEGCGVWTISPAGSRLGGDGRSHWTTDGKMAYGIEGAAPPVARSERSGYLAEPFQSPVPPSPRMRGGFVLSRRAAIVLNVEVRKERHGCAARRGQPRARASSTRKSAPVRSSERQRFRKAIYTGKLQGHLGP